MTEIKLYNTRTRQKEAFKPIREDDVRMYVCGPTVYDRAHIGNARPVVVFDVLYRLLCHVYGTDAVTYVRNFTDVDDRIIGKAVETKRPDETLEGATRRITDETIGWYHADMDALGALRPDHEPRCTEFIEPMVTMTEALIDKGHAYAAEGHVLFAVESYAQYGRLSGRSIDDMIAGARVEVAPYKRNPMDFVLWKPSTDEQPGWDSPWGRGRPGWHIECSAMAREILGEVFDIHAGGIDLQFPHHENELAQSCCVHGTDVMANWWMHNEMVRVEGQKMSKSLGNFFTVRDLLDQGYSGAAVRYGLLATHYRSASNWSAREVDAFERRFENLLSLIGAQVQVSEALGSANLPTPSQDIVDPLSNDLNTHLALQNFMKRAGALETNAGKEVEQVIADGNILGLFDAGPPQLPKALSLQELHAKPLIGELLKKLDAARAANNFADSDQIRNGLLDAGVKVQIDKSGSSFELSPDFDPAKLEALK